MDAAINAEIDALDAQIAGREAAFFKHAVNDIAPQLRASRTSRGEQGSRGGLVQASSHSQQGQVRSLRSRLARFELPAAACADEGLGRLDRRQYQDHEQQEAVANCALGF